MNQKHLFVYLNTDDDLIVRRWQTEVVEPQRVHRLILDVLLQEESGGDDLEALDVYQQCLGELLLALAGTQTAFLSKTRWF